MTALRTIGQNLGHLGSLITRAIFQMTQGGVALVGLAVAFSVIALTANVMQGAREACLAAGMNEYMAKPVRIEDLVTKLRCHLSLRKPAAEAELPPQRPPVFQPLFPAPFSVVAA